MCMCVGRCLCGGRVRVSGLWLGESVCVCVCVCTFVFVSVCEGRRERGQLPLQIMLVSILQHVY